MGEVYRACDTRLERTVAIKLLAADIAADPAFRERFDLEARTISSLDHPHICALFDIGHDEAAGVDYLVMQHLDGETLAHRIASAAEVPLDLALRYAAEIAGALAAAHRAGIIHRDLKPANVMITKGGVKLLDFGLAKRTDAFSTGSLTLAATQAKSLTEKGSLLGTLQYMSPEQLEGGHVDARSDIFSFGAMFFELLTGRRAFEGKSQASIIAAILNGRPPSLTARGELAMQLPAATQRTVERLLQKCLARHPDDRWESAADLADELRWIDEERIRNEQAPDAGARPRRRQRGWMAAGIAATLVAVALVASDLLAPAPPPQTVAFVVDPPENERFAGGPATFAISPDGRRLAFLDGQGKHRLWVRPLDSTTARLLNGTEESSQPSWSPDSRFVLFTVGGAGGPLKKIDVVTGQITTIVAETVAGRSAWSPAGVIVYRPRKDRNLMRVADSGGESTPVTELDKTVQESQHDWPVFLSDGRRFIYLARMRSANRTALYLGSIDSMVRTLVVADVRSNVDYASGYILYGQGSGASGGGVGPARAETTLMARPFDEARPWKYFSPFWRLMHRQPLGAAMPVVENVLGNADNGRTAFSESKNGVLAYRTGQDVTLLNLGMFDRAGKLLQSIEETAAYFSPQFSPDGHRFAVPRRDAAGHRNLWVTDLDRGMSAPLTTDTADNYGPVWSPDGTQIYFASNRAGVADLYIRRADGVGTEELLYASGENKMPTGVSRAGDFLLFDRDAPGDKPRHTDIWALPLKGDRKPFAVLATAFNEAEASFSPDGRWIVYASNLSGSSEIYAQPFPGPGPRVKVSTSGGLLPAWTADSRNVVYSTFDEHLMMADVAVAGGELKPGRPSALPVPLLGGPNARLFAMSANGDRFLVATAPPSPAERPITVVVNWRSALLRK
jgi:eukaryotic-like serine/threonine-protein kinase